MTNKAITLGMSVMPEFVQCEGLDQVMRNVVDIAGATSITTVPSVMEPADAASGGREPPEDGGAGQRRLLDRALWGERALFVRTAPSFEPDLSLYQGGPYAAPAADGLTRRAGFVVKELLAACRGRGVETYLQVMAAIPPGIRVQFGGPRPEDRAVAAGAARIAGRVDNNGSLASPAIRQFMRALITDVARAYPEADGFKFDWPEYPPYEFESLLFDYSPAACALGERLGFDVDAIRAGVVRETDALLAGATEAGVARLTLLVRQCGLRALIMQNHGLAAHCCLRAAIVADYATFLAAEVRALGRKIFLQGFPPPWNLLSGFDVAALDGTADAIGVKLYTMHWPMIERNYVERLAARGLVRGPALAALVRTALATSARMTQTVEELRYPDPDEPHPANDGAIVAKLAEARAEANRSEFWAIGHGYGPEADVRRRLVAAALGSGGRVYLNRYGYLSDAKLRMVGDVVGGGA